MINKHELNSEFRSANREINANMNTIIEQNKKIYEIDEKLNNVDDKMKITDKYVSGFRSFFGFFPKLFSSGKNKKEEIAKKDEKSLSGVKCEHKVINTKSSKPDDILEDEIFELNQNAKRIREEINNSIKGVNDLDKKFDKSNKKLEKVKNEAKKYKNDQ